MSYSIQDYRLAIQCKKSLWLQHHQPEKAKAKSQTIDDTKDILSSLLISTLSKGVDARDGAFDFDDMVDATSRTIDEGNEAIHYPAFRILGFDFSLQSLVYNGQGYDAYLLSVSTSIKDRVISDFALYAQLIRRVVHITSFKVVHVTKGYVKTSEVVGTDILTIVDVTEDVVEKSLSIDSIVASIPIVVNDAGSMPKRNIGSHCTSPFECDFKEQCWKGVSNTSPIRLYREKMGVRFSLAESYKCISDMPFDAFKQGSLKDIQAIAARNGTPYVNKSIIEKYFKGLVFPIHFLDFETFQDAIPRFMGQKTYQQMPFQYSLHVLHEDGRIEHKEFLADEHKDPRLDFANGLANDLEDKGSIVVYHQAFEKGRIKETADYLSDSNPILAALLTGLLTRIVDLLAPFTKGGYYMNEFAGSLSIKSVLPALFPNDPELDYGELGTIKNGEDAMNAFPMLRQISDLAIRRMIRDDLLAYCNLDTLAMVKIQGFIASLASVYYPASAIYHRKSA